MKRIVKIKKKKKKIFFYIFLMQKLYKNSMQPGCRVIHLLNEFNFDILIVNI